MAVQMQLVISGTAAEIQAAQALLAKKRGRKAAEAEEAEEEEETEEEEAEEEEAEEEETEDEPEEEEEEEEEEKPAPKKMTQAKFLSLVKKYVEENGRAKGHAILKKFKAKAAKDILPKNWPAALKMMKA